MADRLEGYRRRKLRLPSWAQHALDIGVLPEDETDVVRTKRLLTGVMWVSLPVSTVSSLQLGLVFDAPPAGWTVALSIPMATITLLALRLRPTSYPGIVHLVVGTTILISFALVVMAGGLAASGANSVWAFVGILGGLAVFGDRRATFWLWVFVVSQALAVVWSQQIDPIYEVTNPELVTLFNLIVVGLFSYFMLYYYVRQRALLMQQSETLLRNILPTEIAERLKISDATIADAYDQASVLFADVVDFTPMSAGMRPAELVNLLDEVFTALDELVEERDLEKIKTIGDAYMVAAGVPRPRGDHAQVLCDLALAVQELVATKDFAGHRISFRIGINSGPVVAGIIGTKKFSYDLWGDSVNTASRMESSGTAGGIQITDATKRLVETEYVCDTPRTIDVKGKGQMQVWSLAGRRS